MEIREQKGLQIAEKSNIIRSNGLWLVPSQSGRGKYKVNAEKQTCTCPDFDIRRQPCKHIYAVEVTIKTTHTAVTKNGVTTTTETVKVTRKTYAQPSWPAYHRAQVNEKRLFLYLLNQLCQGVGSPAQYGAGRKRLPLEDMLFAMAFKVYSTVSARRFMSDLTDAKAKGYISNLPCYNSIFNYFESETLTAYLQMLIEESSLPLASIEQDFAVDSSGLSTCRFAQWVQAKYHDSELREKREWIKVHLMCGVKTNIITAVEITDRFSGDALYFKPLVERTAQGFVMREISADKAYLSRKNLQAAVDQNAMPYIPFRSDSTESSKHYRQTTLWKNMYHYFAYNNDRFMAHYHKRSNVETTFMMLKAKFGDSLRSKTRRAQINEALCKVLCHNIVVLISAMHELNLKPKFYAAA